ncbi:uncharacterized protein [Primulina eburnea]|uniref:uncharacterized protein n=1 Tax=Primulina eburnea TaxID=1245227 RepID=UPI003C6C8F7A
MKSDNFIKFIDNVESAALVEPFCSPSSLNPLLNPTPKSAPKFSDFFYSAADSNFYDGKSSVWRIELASATWFHVDALLTLQELEEGCTFSILLRHQKDNGLQHWFKNWQHLRKHKLTASTFGMAVGFWPRGRIKLWLEKLGFIEPFSGNLATCWSNIKEEEALERYKLITGNPISFPEFQVHGKKNPEDNWLAASPDGVVDSYIYGLPSHGVLEIKCPFFAGDMTRAYPWKRVPLYYIPQAQGLMEILDRDWMDMYVWTVHGSSLFRLYRNEEYWYVLKMALSDFWWKHVQPAKEICNTSVITNPLVELKSFRPAPKHELCSYIVHESKIVVDNSDLLMREIHGKLQY